MEIPSHLKFSKEHEWIELDPKGDTAKIGITEYAQEKLGDIVFVELPEEKTQLKAQDECGTVESVKAVSSVYLPVAGKVLSVNSDLEDVPEVVNHDPYGKGWLVQIAIQDAAELEGLMDANAYQDYINDL